MSEPQLVVPRPTPVRPSPAPATPGGDLSPRRRVLVIVLSVLAGFALTVVWSAHFVDSVIGDTVADGLLGHDARDTPITGVTAGILFAFVSGLAGTFTACNIAVFGAMAPVLGEGRSVRQRLAATLRPLGWITAGMVAVSATYGAIAALVGTRMPQFSTAPTSTGAGLPPRLIQSMVVFGLIGVVLIYLGLAAVGVLPDPLARVSARFPGAYPLVLGALIGAFLIGRPFPLFRMMFRDAAESHNPLYGAIAFVLQSVGNMVVVAVLLLVLAYAMGGRLGRWLTARPGRVATVTGAALLVAGSFTLLYWDVRLLARFDLIWFPSMPWN
ncbi:hypothetical protein [Plantactinospora mayteni]|nr:hypothetical protein [Plantactinospora mayteni]